MRLLAGAAVCAALAESRKRVVAATESTILVTGSFRSIIGAPTALYPDPLLAQALVASTYPLEVIQLQQWLEKHKDLKDKALADAVQQQDWDPPNMLRSKPCPKPAVANMVFSSQL